MQQLNSQLLAGLAAPTARQPQRVPGEVCVVINIVVRPAVNFAVSQLLLLLLFKVGF
jgi:hypothetical protein